MMIDSFEDVKNGGPRDAALIEEKNRLCVVEPDV